MKSSESQHLRRELSLVERRGLLDETVVNSSSGAEPEVASSSYDQSCMVSSRKMKTTEIYDKLMGTERPVGVFFYGLFLILCPLVFRYALFSSIVETTVKKNFELLGNATITVSTDWSCQKCLGYNGVTLSMVTVETYNVTDPNIRAGFPSIALFASQDFVKW